MTKVTILGEEPKGKKKLKPIKFVKRIGSYALFEEKSIEPRDYKNIILIQRDYNGAGIFSLMLAYDYNTEDGTAFLGHFNDGIVE